MSDQRAPDSSPAVSPWAPLGRPLFRYVWIATVVSNIGSWAVFLLNALSYLGVIGVLIWWQREQPERALPSGRLVGAFRSGLHFVWHAPALQTVKEAGDGAWRSKRFSSIF